MFRIWNIFNCSRVIASELRGYKSIKKKQTGNSIANPTQTDIRNIWFGGRIEIDTSSLYSYSSRIYVINTNPGHGTKTGREKKGFVFILLDEDKVGDWGEIIKGWRFAKLLSCRVTFFLLRYLDLSVRHVKTLRSTDPFIISLSTRKKDGPTSRWPGVW